MFFVKFYIAGFEILTAVALKISIFWDVTPCSRINKILKRTGGKNIEWLVTQLQQTWGQGIEF